MFSLSTWREEVDGTCMSITVGTGVCATTKGSYADGLDKSQGSDAGSQRIDYTTRGAYKIEKGKMTVRCSKFRTEIWPMLVAANGGKVNGIGNVKVPVTVSRTHPKLGHDTDLLDGVCFTNAAAAWEAGNTAEVTELELTIEQIYWTDKRITINDIGTAATR